MNTDLVNRLAAFVSAALLTVAMLAGVNALALSEAPADLLARAGVGAQG